MPALSSNTEADGSPASIEHVTTSSLSVTVNTSMYVSVVVESRIPSKSVPGRPVNSGGWKTKNKEQIGK